MAVMSKDTAMGESAMDDLPRTLRREREARDRAQKPGYQNPGQLSAGPPAGSFVPEQSLNHQAMGGHQPLSGHQQMGERVVMSGNTVTDIRIPFFRLMMFGFKLVFAAIPALILLLALLWLFGHALMTYFPWLVKVQLLIKVP